MLKKILVYFVLIVLSFISGYYTKSATLKVVKITPQETPKTAELKLPECAYGKCPIYFSMDVDGDHLSESVVVIPTAMTQGAGKVWIIDEGKVIFDSGEMAGIWVEEIEGGNGFILSYMSDI